MKTILVVAAVLSTILALAVPASASCRISNRTKWSFKVASGNTSNQHVGSHTTTSIASGRIKGVDAKNGKTIGGSCKDGDELEIIDDEGIPVLVHK